MKTAEIRLSIPKVENIEGNSGEVVKNQFIIRTADAVIFQSYSSIIAVWQDRKLTLGCDWDYSTTTGKYRNMFINEFTTLRVDGKKDIERLIKAGEITVDNNLQ